MIDYDFYAKLRTERGLKDSDVAKKAKIPPSTFTDWKKGKSAPKEEKMRKIADALGISYFQLIGADQYEVKEEISAITKELFLLKEYLMQLNEEGFQEAKKRIEELTQLSKYKKGDD